MNISHFENQKNASLSHQLIKVGRLINDRGLNSVRTAFSLPELKQSHLDLFPYIDYGGSRISEIAKRKRVSKQSVSKLVKEMAHLEILSLKVDPNDSRSKIVCFKTSGHFSIQKGLEALISIDRLIVSHLGNKSYKSILDGISVLIGALKSEREI